MFCLTGALGAHDHLCASAVYPGAEIKVIPQEQMAERIMEQIVDVPVPQIPEQIVDVPVLQIMDGTVEAAKLIPQERIQQRTLEEIVNVPVLQIQEQIVAVGKALF